MNFDNTEPIQEEELHIVLYFLELEAHPITPKIYMYNNFLKKGQSFELYFLETETILGSLRTYKTVSRRGLKHALERSRDVEVGLRVQQ